MAKNRASFGESVSKGLDTTYSVQESKGNKKTNTSSDANAGVNPYYEYHERIGARGKKLGAPRKQEKAASMSFSCSESEKMRIKKAADRENRKIADFLRCAVSEYIDKHYDF